MNILSNPKYSILVVDDDIELNTTFALLLEFEGHEVRTAYTCEAALPILETCRFNLIIAEHWLPGMKGDEFALLVKEKWPDQPIILTTSNMDALDQFDYPLAEVDCILNKPFTLAQLREAVSWVLDRYAENRLDGPEIHGAPHRDVAPSNDQLKRPLNSIGL